MATIDERNILAKIILPSVGSNATPLHSDREVTGFLSMEGCRYDQKLMVVGRAVNGWTNGILPCDLVNPTVSASYAQQVFNSVTGTGTGVCPMLWVTDRWGNPSGYNTKKSAFWRVIRAVVDQSGIADVNKDDWPSHLVWSNLYKVAPADVGNPSQALQDIQFPGCLSLFEIELSTYLPHCLLLLTGLNWAKPFLNSISATYSIVHGSYVQAMGRITIASTKTTNVVVAVHPQGTDEDLWVQQVMDAFRDLIASLKMGQVIL